VPEQLLYLAFQVREGKVQGRPAGIDDNRPRRAQFREVQTHRFPEPAFDAVANDGAPQRARRSEADTRSFGSSEIKSRKVRASVSLAAIVDVSEIAGS
jgi:hypothetical protein